MWPAEFQISDIRFRGSVSALNLCPKPNGLNPYDVIEILNPEGQVRMQMFEKKRGILWSWRTDMCMWKVRLMEPAETRESVIVQERIPEESTATYLWLPSINIRLVDSQRRTMSNLGQDWAAPAIPMEPPYPRHETRIFPLESLRGVWQIEYPDEKVTFSHLIVRGTETDELHVWKDNDIVIEEQAVTLTVDSDETYDLGRVLGRNPRRPAKESDTGKMLAAREKWSKVIPKHITDYAEVMPGEKRTYKMSTRNFEDAILNESVVFDRKLLEDMDVTIHAGMFVRTSIHAKISTSVNKAAEYAKEDNTIQAARTISYSISVYGDIDEVPAELYKTRGTYWRKMASQETNLRTKERYEQYASDDFLRAETRMGTYQVGSSDDPVRV